MAKARQQYFADEISLQKDSREFAIADDVQQKIDSIEEGAQVNVIETVKVNGTALTPDANKAVDIDVPDVIDNLYTTSSDDALSANQGKLLYDYIQNLSSRGRFLSNWNTATGLPTTNPSESPYTYRTGDYYIVSNVAPSGGTDYRPNGSQYVIGQASTTVETETVAVSDIYLYDGTNWLLLSNSGRAIAIDSSLSTTSTNPVENRVITNELNKKYYGVVSNTAPSNPAEGMLWYDTTNDILKTYDGANWNEAGTQMVVLSYGNSTWNDFITAYANNAVVYCRASNQADPGTGSQTRMAFMAYVNNATTPTEVEFQYYRSRADHNSAANQLDQVFVYKLTSASGGTWTVTERNTAAKATAGTGINLTYGNGNMTIANTGVTSFNGNTGAVTYTAPVTSVNGQTGAVTVNEPIVSSTAPSSPTEGMIWYDTTNDQLKVYDGSNWDAVENEYNAGEGISIGTVQDYSAMRGPAPDGFHVPLSNEWVALSGILTTTFSMANNGTTMKTYLKMPFAGGRNYSSASVSTQGSSGLYWSSSRYDADNADLIYFTSTALTPQTGSRRAYGFSVRCFKNSPVIPTSSWITLYDGSSVATGAGVFWNSTDGLISVSGDGQTWYTIQDKNLGATTVYNDGDTLSEANCGKYYQRGNNYGFPRTGTIANQSTTQVDASNYGPGNYYSSDTFIKYNGRWDSTDNGNLRGGVTGVVTLDNAITNTGVLSVNGQTGDVVIQAAGGDVVGPSSSTDGDVALFDGTTGKLIKDSGVALSSKADASDLNTKTFYLSSTSDLTTAQAAYDWWAAGKNPIIIYTQVSYSVVDDSVSGGVKNISFVRNNPEVYVGNSASYYRDYLIRFTINQTTSKVESITATGTTEISGKTYNMAVLAVNKNYSTPYTPLYDGSPATKKYVDDRDTYIGSSAPTSNLVEGRLRYDTTNDQLKVYDGTNWNVTGKEYNAGPGISIGAIQDYSAMQGPAPDGFRVPSKDEWVALCGILTTTFSMAADATTMGTYLKMPMAGYRSYTTASVTSEGSSGRYWSYTPNDVFYAYFLNFNSSTIESARDARARSQSIRCFKDTPIVPTSSWTTLYDGSSVASGAGVFYNATDGLISVSGDGTTWYTIQDKNLGATTVFNQGDTLTDANCGYFYQRGNNYGFAHSGNLTTSSTKVDASNYGPGNYYSSDTFITVSASPYDWSSVQNDNLWGATTGVVTINDAITNTGVLSVNGQTGDVTVEGGITKIFTLSGTGSSAAVLAEAQDIYDWYDASKEPIVDYNGRRYHLTRMDSTYLYFTADYVYSANYRYAKSLKFTVSSGSVTNVELFEKTINITTSVPSSGDANTIYFVK